MIDHVVIAGLDPAIHRLLEIDGCVCDERIQRCVGWRPSRRAYLLPEMVGICASHTQLSCPAKAGHPARRGLSIPSQTSLGYWIVRSSRTMTAGVLTQLRSSRRQAPEILPNTFALFENRGRGECRVPSAPAASCALGVVSMYTSVHSGGTGITRHSRTRMVLTAYGVLSPATNSSCHRRRRIDGLTRPVELSKTFADLTPATGARTTRFGRTLQHRSSSRAWIAHGTTRPAIPFRARRCRVHRIPSQRS
jgi:hypothetical protein